MVNEHLSPFFAIRCPLQSLHLTAFFVRAFIAATLLSYRSHPPNERVYDGYLVSISNSGPADRGVILTLGSTKVIFKSPPSIYGFLNNYRWRGSQQPNQPA
jgi:hypothetical protein